MAPANSGWTCMLPVLPSPPQCLLLRWLTANMATLLPTATTDLQIEPGNCYPDAATPSRERCGLHACPSGYAGGLAQDNLPTCVSLSDG
ncbi:hypothetical protein BO94DRAFT_534325 [Aspergillus sclerotioniger CBS 115572]|uniref:Uncharacterized protein n=1 Tax=Aspergillus sclerotioniger CBS 115572 TaxID=1450535 RepID=A0A317WW57_9EURO|nr:hypothetical protein BO94DRAFT_534325 [Aspergillus sclerotioniger CBS 115572]PWY89552.1 hypothetical protein BO94DRAFT_534325 [Aspergillus sclerotioniger CBS 115572]